MRLSRPLPRWGCWGALLSLSLGLLLTGCAAWTNPAKPSAAFADDAAACRDEVAQAALASGQFDVDQDNAYHLRVSLVAHSASEFAVPASIIGQSLPPGTGGECL